MTVVVPHSSDGFAPQIHLALKEECDAQLRYCAEFTSYFYLVKNLWEQGETFIIVEHDIVPWPGALTQLWNCECGWCSFPYYTEGGWLTHGFGCVKFADHFIANQPHVFNEPLSLGGNPYDKGWKSVDGFVLEKLLGNLSHLHMPGVAHLRVR